MHIQWDSHVFSFIACCNKFTGGALDKNTCQCHLIAKSYQVILKAHTVAQACIYLM